MFAAGEQLLISTQMIFHSSWRGSCKFDCFRRQSSRNRQSGILFCVWLHPRVEHSGLSQQRQQAISFFMISLPFCPLLTVKRRHLVIACLFPSDQTSAPRTSFLTGLSLCVSLRCHDGGQLSNCLPSRRHIILCAQQFASANAGKLAATTWAVKSVHGFR